MVSRKNFVETDKLHHRLSELEQNQTEERYGIKKKKRCGLCHLEYSLINLVLSVPFKAVQDLRNTWAEEFETHKAHVKECSRTHKAFTYDQVGVCVLCSQFFQLGQQDMYRPSYEKRSPRRAARRGRSPRPPPSATGTPSSSSRTTAAASRATTPRPPSPASACPPRPSPSAPRRGRG